AVRGIAEEGEFGNVKRYQRLTAVYLLAGAGLCLAAWPALAQDPPASAPPPKQDAPKPKPNTDSAVQSAPDQPMWDPLRAEKDMEVGKYYMKKGDVDAAIDRFQDAAQAKPWYAIPFLYLGGRMRKRERRSRR